MTETVTIRPHRKVQQRLIDKGFEAYQVGGCVRDQLIGRTPKDYDITTDALPEQVQAIFGHTIPVGQKFGVVVVMIDNTQVEVATFRADGAYTDGRRPDEVRYSKTVKEDVIRRDFTMNGLLRDNNYELVDHVGGLDDIHKELIRAIGDPNVRFAEDALRMLRACRFAAQLGFTIEEKTYEAIEGNARLLNVISRERVAMELFRLLSAPEPLKGLQPFITTGLYRFALPEQFANHINMTHTIQRFGMFNANKDPMLGMAMLMADIRFAFVSVMCAYLKFSTEQRQALVQMASTVLTFRQHLTGAAPLTDAALKRVCRHPGLELALEIMTQDELMGLTSFGTEALMAFVLRVRAFKPEDIKPVPLVTGKDLIDMGLEPGPLFTSVLFDVETAQLNNPALTREHALATIKERIWKDNEGHLTYELRGLDAAL